MKTISFDVWFASGVNVNVPAGTDPDTAEGVEAIKAAAIQKMLDAVAQGSIDIECERYEEGDDAGGGKGWDIFDTGDGRLVVQCDDDHEPRLGDDEAIRLARAAGVRCDDDGVVESR